MSNTAAITELPRRRPTAKQADMVRRLVEAATEEIKASGYDDLTVRNVAARAGVAAATAYTYFASKDHLIAEAFWRRLRALPPPHVDRRRGPAARVGSALGDLTEFLASEPELAAAATSALLASDPDVKHIRDRVGGEIRRRIEAALDGRDDDVVGALELAVAGAMIQAGMGHLSYGELPSRVAAVAALLVKDRR